jgi:hypothetical protein
MGPTFQPIEDHQEAVSRKTSATPGFDLQGSGSWSSDEVYLESFEAKASNNREITVDIRPAQGLGSRAGGSK